jgi:tRNA (guanine37-N1)-methyltransferase
MTLPDNTHKQHSEMFTPPVNRAMRVLDRSFFKKVVPLTAALVFENSQISQCRRQLGKEVLEAERLSSVIPEPNREGNNSGRKAVLLQPQVRPNDPATWSKTLQQLVEEGKVSVMPYDLDLTYEYWTYRKEYIS